MFALGGGGFSCACVVFGLRRMEIREGSEVL